MRTFYARVLHEFNDARASLFFYCNLFSENYELLRVQGQFIQSGWSSFTAILFALRRFILPCNDVLSRTQFTFMSFNIGKP